MTLQAPEHQIGHAFSSSLTYAMEILQWEEDGIERQTLRPIVIEFLEMAAKLHSVQNSKEDLLKAISEIEANMHKIY